MKAQKLQMRILFIDTYYYKFLNYFYNQTPDLKVLSYYRYKKKLIDIFFGTADFYSYNMQKLDWKTDEIIINDSVLQGKWAKEKRLKIHNNQLLSKLQSLPYANKFLGEPKWIQETALEQVRQFKPDVVYMHNLSVLNLNTLENIKKDVRLLVGQIASPLPSDKYLKKFDLIVTSFPHFVKKFKKMGIGGEYQKLAFEPRVLKKIGQQKRIYDVTFVGSFSPYHHQGTKLLEKLAQKIPVHVWGQGLEFLSPFSPLRKNYHGEAWGLDMYKIFAKSKIVVNRHISVADGYANNMRMFEATGMGALLITDYKKNLGDIFEIDEEVVAYKDAEDLVGKVDYYLKNDEKREKIAKAGQKRTLVEHNYNVRMRELVRILKKYLK